MELKSYYFTYGLDGQPFRGGWTRVNAPDRHVACELFKLQHPCKTEGIINCAEIYDAATFEKTEMFKEGNFGARCWEVITFLVIAGESAHGKC